MKLHSHYRALLGDEITSRGTYVRQSLSHSQTFFNQEVKEYSHTVQVYSHTVQMYSQTVQVYSHTVQVYSHTVQVYSHTVQSYSKVHLYCRVRLGEVRKSL